MVDFFLLFKVLVMTISLSYLWLVYFLLFYSLLKKTKYDLNYRKPVSVVIPCYNEPYENLKNCVDSIIKAKGEKQIILVNNNSKMPSCLEAIEEYKKNPNVEVYNEKRQGKRFGHSKGLSKAKHEIVVFVDSDTIIDENAIIELVIPFQDERIGGVTGQIRVSNRKDNLITRSIDAMFWGASNIYRRASTGIGFMQVMPGALSAYRKENLLKLEDMYLNQKFLGSPCAISDDRFLTMRIQTRLNKKIHFTDKAIAYTSMPSTFRGFWKTLVRWRRGMIREVLLLWKEPRKNARILFWDTQFNFAVLNIVIVLRIIYLIFLIIHPSIINLLYGLFWLVVMNILWGAYILVNKPSLFPFKVTYSFFYEFFWIFTYFDAIIHIKNQGGWVTR
jgi:hyaluronan synthase